MIDSKECRAVCVDKTSEVQRAMNGLESLISKANELTLVLKDRLAPIIVDYDVVVAECELKEVKSCELVSEILARCDKVELFIDRIEYLIKALQI
jgi:hypothetical protein